MTVHVSITPRERYKALVDYLIAKVEERDWHGVADAACDLRVLVAKYPECEREEAS